MGDPQGTSTRREVDGVAYWTQVVPNSDGSSAKVTVRAYAPDAADADTDAVLAIAKEEAARWRGTLAALADYDTWCADPVCPSCNERRRRTVEEA